MINTTEGRGYKYTGIVGGIEQKTLILKAFIAKNLPFLRAFSWFLTHQEQSNHLDYHLT